MIPAACSTPPRISAPRPHDGISRRTARLLGWGGLIAALVAPAVVWRKPIAAVATDFSLEPQLPGDGLDWATS